MLLDELVGVIETLKERIGNHRDVLAANEYRTRVSLIDPLLCALGWDTADPSLVTLEFDVGGRRADYALLGYDGKPIVFLEAKRLSESLSSHRSQMALYASELGIRYPALTNGDRWEVYDNSKMVPIEERRILDVSISGDDSAKLALKLLLLWRANIASDAPIHAPEPIAGLESDVLETTDRISKDQTVASPADPISEGWRSLDEIQITPEIRTPPTMRFFNGEEQKVGSWKSVMIQVAEWLVRQGILDAADCPVFTVRGESQGYALVNTNPVHPNGANMNGSHQLSNGLYVAAGQGLARESVDRANHLIRTLGQDPAKVWLKTG